MNQDSIHYLFPNLNKLLNFQRKFLIRLESTAELPWQDQRWGLHFSENVSTIVFFNNNNKALILECPLSSPFLVLFIALSLSRMTIPEQ
jgi:hypothetical protein